NLPRRVPIRHGGILRCLAYADKGLHHGVTRRCGRDISHHWCARRGRHGAIQPCDVHADEPGGRSLDVHRCGWLAGRWRLAAAIGRKVGETQVARHEEGPHGWFVLAPGATRAGTGPSARADSPPGRSRGTSATRSAALWDGTSRNGSHHTAGVCLSSARYAPNTIEGPRGGNTRQGA